MTWCLFIGGMVMSAIFINLGKEYNAITTAILYGSMVIAEAIENKKTDCEKEQEVNDK